jgi:hypothetical protein
VKRVHSVSVHTQHTEHTHNTTHTAHNTQNTQNTHTTQNTRLLRTSWEIVLEGSTVLSWLKAVCHCIVFPHPSHRSSFPLHFLSLSLSLSLYPSLLSPFSLSDLSIRSECRVWSQLLPRIFEGRSRCVLMQMCVC